MGRPGGGFAAFAKATTTEPSDRPPAPKPGSQSSLLTGTSSGGNPGKSVTFQDLQPEGVIGPSIVTSKPVPAGAYGRYEVLLKRMPVRPEPSRSGLSVSWAKKGKIVVGVPYDVCGNLWLHLDDLSCQELEVATRCAWMMINGEEVGELMKLLAERRPTTQEESNEGDAGGGKPSVEEALWRAAKGGDAHQAAQLLMARADPNACDELGETALFETAVMGCSGVLSALLLVGADASKRSSEGACAAELAARPLLAAALRAFMGNEFDRANFCSNPAFQKEFGAPAHAGMIRQLESMVGTQPNASAPPPFTPSGWMKSTQPGLLQVQEVKDLETARKRIEQEKSSKESETDNDYDWGRLFWDVRLEHARFRVTPAEGTRAMSSVPESPWVRTRMLQANATVLLLPSAQPYLGEDSHWVYVSLAADEDIKAPSAPSSTPPSWWVQWNHLELIPSQVQTLASHEEAQAEKLLLQEHFDEGEQAKRDRIIAMHQIRWRTRKLEDDMRLSRYTARVCHVAKVRFTSATINESGRFYSGRATTGVARLVESTKEREERLEERRKIELEEKKKLAGSAEDLGTEDEEAPDNSDALPAVGDSAAAAAGAGEGGGGGDARCPTARALSPDVVRGRVSVLVPTDCRRHYLHDSLYRYFCMQEWPDKELLVLDSGGDPSPFFTVRPGEEPPGPKQSLQPSPMDDPRVRYIHVRKYGLTLGDKRNQLLQLASGEIIANFDDDNVYAPDYLTLMVEQLRSSGAQTVRLASCFSWDPFSDHLLWHDEMRGRGETFVHFKGPTRILRYDQKDVGEEEGFTAACVAHDVDDVYGIFAHVHHGENCSSLVQEQAKAPSGVRVTLADVPNQRLRAILPRRRSIFIERFGKLGPPMRWAHLADLNRGQRESKSAEARSPQR